MGSITPIHGLPYPGSGDADTPPADIQALATALDGLLPVVQSGTPTGHSGLFWLDNNNTLSVYDGSTWRVILSDTGWVNSGITAVTTGAAQTTLQNIYCRAKNGVATVKFDWKLATGSITVGSDGNIAGDAHIATITDSRFIPTSTPLNQGLVQNGAGPLAGYTVLGDGTINVTAVAPGTTLTSGSGSFLSVGGTYLLG